MVFVASYTANLASQLTILELQSSISGIDDIKSGNVLYNCIVIHARTTIVQLCVKDLDVALVSLRESNNSDDLERNWFQEVQRLRMAN